MKSQLSNAPLFAPSDALADDEAERLSTHLDALLQADLLGVPEAQTIAYLARVTHEYRPEVILACALALRAPRFGHVCLDLAQPYATLQTATEDTDPANTPETLMAVPAPADWRPLLASSPLVSTHPQATDHPFVLRENLLYTQRYFVYEKELNAQLLERAARAPEPPAKTGLYPALFAGLFPNDKEEAGRQALSAALSLVKPLTVISGGPGMGKTYTVRAILFLHLVRHHLSPEGPPLQVALLAPSGKAAARLRESLFKDFRSFLETCHKLVDAQPDLHGLDVEAFFETRIEYSTIHRSLGFQPQTPTRFQYDAENPLPYDLLVVDETSMVDLPLMTKTLAALRTDARLILLGDAYQLASVAAGSVLSDISGPTHAGALTLSDEVAQTLEAVLGLSLEPRPSVKPRSALHDAVIHYNTNFRFSSQSGIGNFAKSCLELYNQHDASADALVAGLQADAADDLILEPLPEADSLPPNLQAKIVEAYTSYLELVLRPDETLSPQERYAAALKAFEGFRVLTPHRRGPLGVEELNATIEVTLERALGDRLGFRVRDLHYRGRPILIRQNDYETGLFNGDIGLVVDRHRAVFPDAEVGIREIPLARLPRHETVFAMTVHSSQGSEFRDVLLTLPAKTSAILTRELLYTAVTRGREKVTIAGPAQVLREGLEATVKRVSGLRDRLWTS